MVKFTGAISPAVVVTISVVILLCACDKTAPRFECTDPIECVTVAPGEAIRIGVLQSLSGKIAPLGTAQIRGIELAMDKRQGRILSHAIELQI